MNGKKVLNLALQGGGAHGAYTWGVLDRLLEDERIIIEGISGTSAGAMNAAVIADGYTEDGYPGARHALERFWRKISEMGKYSPFQKMPVPTGLNDHPWNLDGSPVFQMYDILSRFWSPYQLNPMNYNPLREVLEEVINIERVNACSLIKVFIAATRVRDGQPRVFRCGEVTIDVLLASACLPLMFQAVEIDGEAYWDGGFMGNPAIWPLIYYCKSPDVLLIQINPKLRDEVPVTAIEIINRMNEINFNSSLIAEMRAIHFVSELINTGELDSSKYKSMHIHMIERPEEMIDLNASSKLNPSWEFFLYLKELGRNAAAIWLDNNCDKVGSECSVNIEETFLRKRI